jgi:hypothetical protein
MEEVEVLHLFSGMTIQGDRHNPHATSLKGIIEAWAPEKLGGRACRVTNIDYLNCACYNVEECRPASEPCSKDDWGRIGPCSNLLRDEVYEGLQRDCRAGRFKIVVAGIPCNGYCVARLSGDGNARPLRDRANTCGLPLAGSGRTLNPEDCHTLATSNSLTVRSVFLCGLVYESGGEVLIENPVDYGVFGLWSIDRTGERHERFWWPNQGDHCPLWQTPWLQMFQSATYAQYVSAWSRTLAWPDRRPAFPARSLERDSSRSWNRLLDFAQCNFGADFKKCTSLLATSGLLRSDRAKGALGAFNGRHCCCPKSHPKRAHGRDSTGNYKSAEAATYPLEMNRQLARVVLTFLRSPPQVDTAARHGRLQPLWRLLHDKVTIDACTPQEHNKTSGAQSSVSADTSRVMKRHAPKITANGKKRQKHEVEDKKQLSMVSFLSARRESE